MNNVIALSALKKHWEKPGRRDSEQSLRAWYKEALRAKWKSPNDVKKQYGNASIVGNERVVFNICGNKYRLIVKIRYDIQLVYIRFVGTHKEYDKVDASSI